MTEARRPPSLRRPNEGGVIDDVRAGSIGDTAGLRVGDRVTKIDGRELRDAVDFQFLAAEDSIELEVVRDERVVQVAIEKHPDEDVGIGFQDAAFDGVRTCNNACFFCFLKGNPRGMRKTLYVKDDDYRLSFYHGNFVTLTNLTEDDWRRLDEQRLSPLNVSVHATEPELRRYLLGNKHAPDICEQLRRLGTMGITANTQIVLCPAVNDGDALNRTLSDLTALLPTVQNVSIVPVGATMTAEERIVRGAHGEEIDACTPSYARSVIEQVRPWQQRCRQQHGRTVVYLADEYYLAAGVPLPAARRYDGFPQFENGIGMARTLLDDWRQAGRSGAVVAASGMVRKLSLVCGTLIAPVLSGIAAELGAAIGAEVEVRAIRNEFFGPRVNVSGLLTSADLLAQLSGRDLGDLCVLPRYALDYTGGRFLDDRTPAALQAELGVPIAFASTLSEVLKILAERLESKVLGADQSATSTNGKAWVDYASIN